MTLDAPARVPPHDLDAERAVLGALLLEGRDAVPRVVEVLSLDDFYTGAHREVYAAVLRLFDAGTPVDVITVRDALIKAGALDLAGGEPALALLVTEASIGANLGAYAAIVRDKATLRGLYLAASEIGRMAMDEQADAQGAVDDAERRVFALAERRLAGRARPISGVLREAFAHIERLYERKEHVTGVPTGFERLDRETSGFQPSDLILVAARPSMGKTAIALNVVAYASARCGLTSLVLSLEMSAQQLVQRMLCAEAKVDSHAVRTGYLTPPDWHRLTAAAGRLAEARVFIDDSPALTVLEARAKARRCKAEHGLDLLVIDYLQLMRARTQESRQQEITEISRSLKALAKELAIPVVALSQLSRAVEARAHREYRPQLSDLRESGSLEQDADLVLFLYRARAYKDDLPPEEENVAEVIIGKQRNGPTGTVKLTFLPSYARFENLAARDEKWQQ